MAKKYTPHNRLLVLNDPYSMRVNKELANEIGLNESIVLLQLEFLISISGQERAGRMWVFQTISGLQRDFFPWWSRATIARTIRSLVAKSLLLIGNFNEAAYDQTQWFSLDPEGIGRLRSVRWSEHPSVQNEHPPTPDAEGGVQIEPGDVQNDQGDVHLEQGDVQNETTIHETTTETTTENKKHASHASRETRSASKLKFPKSFADENWLDYFRSKPVWAGIDILREKEKLEIWCEMKSEKPTPRRFVHWLNHADGESRTEQEPLSAQEKIVVEACALKLPLTLKQRAQVRRCTAFLKDHGADSGQLKWCVNTYRHRFEKLNGYRLDPPTPEWICEHWSAYLEWEKTHPVPRERPAPKEICPRCAGTRQVRRIPADLYSPKIPCPVCAPQPAPAQPTGDLAA